MQIPCIGSGPYCYANSPAMALGPGRAPDTPALAGLGRDRAAAVATRLARLVGGLQHDIVAGHSASAAGTLRELAPAYDELAAALPH